MGALHNGPECIICGARATDTHHCLHGPSRKKADKLGLTVRLCRRCHMELHDTGAHDKELQQLAQRYYEEHIGTREEFIKDFIRSYL